jgi:hypothetical protein
VAGLEGWRTEELPLGWNLEDVELLVQEASRSVSTGNACQPQGPKPALHLDLPSRLLPIRLQLYSPFYHRQQSSNTTEPLSPFRLKSAHLQSPILVVTSSRDILYHQQQQQQQQQLSTSLLFRPSIILHGGREKRGPCCSALEHLRHSQEPRSPFSDNNHHHHHHHHNNLESTNDFSPPNSTSMPTTWAEIP